MNFVSKHHQRGLDLSGCADQGTVFWSRANGLTFGIVAGMEATGAKVLIVNNPIDRTFSLHPWSELDRGQWFLDPQNDNLDSLEILENAFVHLNAFGSNSGERYAPDFRFEFKALSPKKATQEFDSGIIKTISHLFLFSESKNALGSALRSFVGIPKKVLPNITNRVKTKSEQPGI